MIVGGDDVFREVLPQASRIYLTEVHASPEADVWFTFDRETVAGSLPRAS